MDEIGLRDLDIPGFIRFSIRAKDTEENVEVHNKFKEYAKLYHRNDYTKALDELLVIAHSSIWKELNEIKRKVE